MINSLRTIEVKDKVSSTHVTTVTLQSCKCMHGFGCSSLRFLLLDLLEWTLTQIYKNQSKSVISIISLQIKNHSLYERDLRDHYSELYDVKFPPLCRAQATLACCINDALPPYVL
jgi:hypothetical protein